MDAADPGHRHVHHTRWGIAATCSVGSPAGADAPATTTTTSAWSFVERELSGRAFPFCLLLPLCCLLPPRARRRLTGARGLAGLVWLIVVGRRPFSITDWTGRGGADRESQHIRRCHIGSVCYRKALHSRTNGLTLTGDGRCGTCQWDALRDARVMWLQFGARVLGVRSDRCAGDVAAQSPGGPDR